MADYAAHAHKAQQILEDIDTRRGKLTAEARIALAQVEALLALAAAVAGQNASTDSR
ncbi:hypothetical protein ACFV6F_09525 [Kitasatospora phosalacinea]|uniref:hypothetical protein n=1 Tax=Kitasatospora phosalacinea TaxID=2065 RepID=UPI00364E762E